MVYRKLTVFFIAGFIFLTSCDGFKRIVQSTDNDMKYEVAMDYFDRKDYNKALQLFDLLQAAYRANPKGENVGYRTALCYFYTADYEVASYYFNKFAKSYPFSKNAEKAQFMSAYCSYLTSPQSSLDQTNTHKAITQLQSFVEAYPKSDSLQRANELIGNLNDKLEEKDYNICQLYYKMENYTAAITSFENMLKDYPNTPHREEILSDMTRTYYDYAENSVASKQRERYEACVEHYSTLSYLYPDSKYGKDLEGIVNKAKKKLENIK